MTINDTLKTRLSHDREMTSITVRMPVDVVESMKRIAPLKGFSGYQPLLKSYLSDALRRDEAQFKDPPVTLERLGEVMRSKGLDSRLIDAIQRELRYSSLTGQVVHAEVALQAGKSPAAQSRQAKAGAVPHS